MYVIYVCILKMKFATSYLNYENNLRKSLTPLPQPPKCRSPEVTFSKLQI